MAPEAHVPEADLKTGRIAEPVGDGGKAWLGALVLGSQLRQLAPQRRRTGLHARDMGWRGVGGSGIMGFVGYGTMSWRKDPVLKDPVLK